MKIRKQFHYEGDCCTVRSCPEHLWSFHSFEKLKIYLDIILGSQLQETLLEQGIGQDDLPSSLPQQFCDTTTSLTSNKPTEHFP